MKIAYLFEEFPSLTETFLAREVEALRQSGLDIEIWALKAGSGAHQIPLPPRALKLSGRTNFLKAQSSFLARKLRKNHITHIHATWANHIADLARLSAKKAHVPWSFAAHARDLWVEGGDLRAKLQAASFAATCTRAGENELKKYGANVLYAPHGLPLENYPFKTWMPESEMRIVGAGRLVEKKGWLDLVVAISLLKQRGANIHAQIIGAGPLHSELEKRISALSVDNEVQLRGALPNDVTIAAMQGANCLILPSKVATDGDRDGLANVLLEAGALGLPIVTTNAGAASDFVDEASGFLLRSNDTPDLADAIERVFANPLETQARCRMARARVEQDFDIRKNIEILKFSFESGFRYVSASQKSV